MDLAGTGYQVPTDALIKAHKPAAMGNGKRQEIAIGDLAWASRGHVPAPSSGGQPCASHARDPTGQ